MELNIAILKRLKKEKLNLTEYIILECIAELNSELFDQLMEEQEYLLLNQKLFRERFTIIYNGEEEIPYILSDKGQELVNELYFMIERD